MKQHRRVGLSIGMALAAILSISCGGDTSSQTPAPKATSKIVLGFYAGDAPVVYHSVTTFTTYLSAVSAARFNIDSTGAVTGSLPNADLVPFDRANGIHTYACVANFGSGGDFDPVLGHSALVTNKTIVINNLVTLTKTGGFDGLNLDFEAIDPTDRDAYSQFVSELATKLHAGGFKLVLSVPSKTADDPTDDWSYPFDYVAIGKDADLLQLMTYDENGPGWSDAGPISGADWVDQCLAYAVSVVSPSKLLIGLPAYGYDWDLTAYANTGAYPFSYVAWTDFPAWLAIPGAVEHWDTTTLSPSVTYTKDGHDHEAWFENTKSIQAKTALVKKYDLAGLSVWSLGQEDLSFWKAAAAGLQ